MLREPIQPTGPGYASLIAGESAFLLANGPDEYGKAAEFLERALHEGLEGVHDTDCRLTLGLALLHLNRLDQGREMLDSGLSGPSGVRPDFRKNPHLANAIFPRLDLLWSIK